MRVTRFPVPAAGGARERRIGGRFLAAVLSATCIGGCGLSGGGAYPDLTLDVTNRLGSPLTVRWTGAVPGSVTIDPCAELQQPFQAGDYTVTVGDPARASFAVHVARTSHPVERRVVVDAAGAVDPDAAPGASMGPCVSPAPSAR